MGLFRINLGCLRKVQLGGVKHQNYISAYYGEDLSLFSMKVLNMDKLFAYKHITIKEPIKVF